MHYFPRSRSGQVHSLMAALTCLRSVETNLTLTCPSPKSFVCNLPDSGRHVTSVFHGLSLSRFVGRIGENPGNEVGLQIQSPPLNALISWYFSRNIPAIDDRFISGYIFTVFFPATILYEPTELKKRCTMILKRECYGRR